jgi:L-alanine-DL-glutamate epimerase-like enolase superfamily enzyme
MGILLDSNFNFKTEGYIKVARACEPYNLFWLEIDSYDPEGLRLIRDRAPMPIASCESLFSRRQFRPFFENRSIDVSIIDVPWNGLAEGYKISTMAEAYEINCAPHNFYGHMSTLMSANLCAAMPNFRIMEIDIDDVPWKDDLVTHPPVIQNGELIVPTRPGWGADINEEAVRAHPPKNPHP